MTFLPIIERELRVRARLRSTYRFRLFAAMGAIGLVGLLLLASETLVAAGKYGGMLFGALAWLSFAYCLLDGARNTADCLSEEKRAGTLGLLFLTDLRPYDVVLGKLIATSLNSFYGLLAIFPPLAIPLVIGGVTVGEFWRLVLVLLNTLFFSAATGLAVSAACRDGRRAWAATFGLTLFFALVPSLLQSSPMWSSSFVAMLGPTTGFLNVFDTAYSVTPDHFWRSFWSVQWMSWGLLVTAMFVLPRAWQDRPRTANGSWWRRLILRQREPGGRRGFDRRSAILATNPVVWLVARNHSQQTFVWVLVGAACVIMAGAWLLASGAKPMGIAIFGLMLLVHLTLAIWVAAEACHLFSGARESGALEQLLCTPLAIRELVEGHVLGLRRVFFRPVAVLVTVELVLLGAQLYLMGNAGASAAQCVGTAALVGSCLVGAVMDSSAAARYGMWQGLANRKPAAAVTKTVLHVLILPVPFFLCGGPLVPLIWVIKNMMFVNFAQEQLRRQFRTLITDRFAWVEESEFVGAPGKRALKNPLPRVYQG
jgi:ABC-type transport system involved in cytochrome c biogenesis permease component